MGVFHVFKTVQIVPNRAKHHSGKSKWNCNLYPLNPELVNVCFISYPLLFQNFNDLQQILEIKMNFDLARIYFIKDNFLPLYRTKSCYWTALSPIFHNTSEQNGHDKPVFKNVHRLNHPSPMKNTVTKKIKCFHWLFALGSQISLKKWHYFLPRLTISTKLDRNVHKYKDLERTLEELGRT